VSASTSKRDRRRLTRSELWLVLAVKTEEWAKQVTDQDTTTMPFAEWPADDSLRVLCRKYDLTPADLAGVLREVGAEAERKAEAAGYADVPDDPA
jgi:hypothetical protein